MNSAYAGPVLKQLYAAQPVEKLYMKDHFWLSLLKKDPGFFGKNKPIVVQYGYGNGRSASFSVAQTNTGNGKYKDFTITRAADYSIARLTNEDVEATENDKGAFVQLLKREVDGAIEASTDSCARDLWGSGTGTIGRLSASAAINTTTVTLATPDDVFKIEEGMVLVASATNGTGTVKAGSVTVTAVDIDSGTFTVSAALSTGIGTVALSDFLFPEGDYNAKMTGFYGWIPDADPVGGDNFFGVDRSINPERLAGLRFDGTGMSIEEGLVKTCAKLNRRKSKPDFAVLHPDDYASLELDLGSKIQYVFPQSKEQADISFKGIKLSHRNGVLTVMSDAYARLGRAAVMQSNTWCLESLKKHIRILNLDGNEKLRIYNQDGIEFRVGGYKNLSCNAPAWNANVQLY